MPLIALLRLEQRAWLRRLRCRIANRELTRRSRGDIDRKLLCPGVDLPIEAGAGGRLIPRESGRCIRCHNRRGRLLNHAFNNAEAAITTLLEAAALEDDAPEEANASADRRTPSRCSTSCLRSAIPACAGSGWRRGRPARCAQARTPNRCGGALAPTPGEPSRSGRGRSGTTADDAGRPWKERDGRGSRRTIVERKCTACV